MAGYVDEKIAKVTLDNKGFTKNAQDTMSALDKLKAAFAKVSGKGAADNVAKDLAKMNGEIANSTEKSNGLLSRLRNIFKRNTDNMDTSGAGRSIDQMNTEVASKTSRTGSILARLKSIFRKTDEGNNFSSTSGEFDKLNAKAGGINLNPLTSAFSYASASVQNSLSIMDIALGNVLANMMQKAIQFGSQFFRGPADGLNEYKDKLGSIQTIMANTEWEIPDQTLRMRKTSKALEDLNQYADKTIYSFADMTRNIGTFTAAGVGLEDSATAIKGISNLAAVSGSSTLQASTAMYQLSQALSSGRVALQDWNSVINAGMGGKLFQDRLTAMGEKLGHARDMTKSFRDSLQDGWLTSEVLIATLKEMSVDEQMLKAATEVKSFSQLVGTVQEAIGSGWAQSWEYLLGGFEEAKSMWTNIGNIVNPFLQDDQGTYFDTVLEMERSLGNYRNAMLKTWKDMGGQQALFDGITSSIKFLIGSLDSLRSGFRSVIGTYQESAATLTQLTFKFRDFAKSLSENVYIQGTMTSIGKTLGTAFQFVGTVLSKIGYGMGIVSGSGNGLILTFKNIADSITNFLNGIMHSNNVMVGLVAIGKTIGNVFGILVSVFKIAVTIVRQFFGAFSGGDGGGFKSFTTTLANITGKIREFVEELEKGIKSSNMFASVGNFISGIFQGIGAAISGAVNWIKQFKMPEFKFENPFKNLFSDSGDDTGEAKAKFKLKISKIGEAIKEALSEMWEKVKSVASKYSLADIMNIILAGLATFAGFKLFKGKSSNPVVDILKEMFGGILDAGKDIGEKMSEVLGGVGDALKSFTTSVKAGSLFLIAAALGILTLSLKALAKLDAEQLTKASIAIYTLSRMLTAAMSRLSNMRSMPKGQMASMIGFAISMRILVSAVKSISDLNPEQLTNGLMGVASLMGMMVLVLKLLDKTQGMGTGLFKMIGFAIAIRILVSALAKLKDMNADQIQNGLLAVIGLIGSMSLAMKLLDGVKVKLGSIVAMITMTISLTVLVHLMKKLAEMSPQNIEKSMSAIFSLLAMMVIATQSLRGASVPLGSLGALITFTLSLTVLVFAIKQLSAIDPGALAVSVTAIGVLLAELVLATRFISGAKPNLGTMGTLLAFATSVYILVQALLPMTSVPWTSLAKSTIAMVVLMAGLVASSVILSNTSGGFGRSLGVAAQLLAFSVVMISIGHVVTQLAAIPWTSLAKSVGAIVVVLGAMVAATAVMSGMGLGGVAGVASLLILSVALMALVVPIKVLSTIPLAALGVALLALAGGLAILVVAGVAATGAAVGLLALSAAMVAFAVAAVGLGAGIALAGIGLTMILQVLVSLAKAGPDILRGLIAALDALLKALAERAPQMMDSLIKIIKTTLNGLVEIIPEMVMFGIKLVIGLIKGLNEALPQLFSEGMKLLKTIADAFIQNMPIIIQTGLDVAIAFINALGDGLIKVKDKLIPALEKMFKIILDIVLKLLKDLIGPILKGIVDILQPVVDFIINILKDLADILAPILKPIGDVLIALFQGVTDIVRSLADVLISLFDNISSIVQSIADVLIQVAQSIESIFTTIGNVLQSFFMTLQVLFMSIASIVQTVVDGIVNAINGFANVITAAGEAVKSIFEGIGIAIRQALEGIASIVESVGQAVSYAFQGIGLAIKSALEGVAAIVESVGNAIKSVFEGVGNAAKSFGEGVKSALQGVAEVFRGIGDGIKAAFNGVASIIDAVGNAAKNAGQGFKLFAQGVSIIAKDGIAGAAGITAVAAAVTGLGSASYAGNLVGFTKDLGSLKGVIAGLAGSAGGIMAMSTGFIMMNAALAGLAGTVPTVSSAFQNLQTPITTLAPTIPTLAAAFSMLAPSIMMSASGIMPVVAGFTQLGAVIPSLSAALQTVPAAFQQAAQGAMMFGTSLGQGIMASAPIVIMAVQQLAIQAVMSAQMAFMQGQQIGVQFGQQIAMGLSSQSGAISAAAQSGANMSISSVRGTFSQGGSIGQQFGSSIASGISGSSGSITGSSSSVANSSVNSIRGVFNQGNSLGSHFGGSVASGISSQSGSAHGAGSSLAHSAYNGASSVSLSSAGSYAGYGFANGLAASAGSIYATASAIASNVAATIRRALDIHSPSRVTKALGKFTGQGFEIGLKDTGSAIFRTAKGLANQAIEALNVDDSLSGLLMDNIDMTIQPTVKPVFDGSLLKDMNNLSGKMNGNLTLPSSYTDRFNQNGNTTITNSDTYTVNVNVENRGNQPINPKELARQVQDELKNMRDAALRSRGEEIAW